MIYTVTFNPSLDYILDVPQFNMEVVNRASKERIIPGGKGINVSIVLQNLGVMNRAICYTAGFTGDALRALLDERNINADYIKLDNGLTRINVKLRCGGETEINGQGPQIGMQDMVALYEKLGYLDEDDFLVLAGSLPDTMAHTTYTEIMQLLQYNHIRIIVDTTKDLLLPVLPYKPFLVKPNAYELGQLFDVEIKTKQDAVAYAKKLQEMGALNVLVSMAADGAVLVTEDGNVYEADAPKGTVRNSVGAGDSMLAGFLAGYMEKSDMEYAFHMGVSAGSASAFSEGFATKSEIQVLYQNFFAKNSNS
ncbi:MAG: 1-phosphofructokinase [Lachnospiraceae bacterium]|nr:1-phosphofructokinase [Lachnospiraceae bacterium]